MAATFQLNSSLVPGLVFNCHLELALDDDSWGSLKIRIKIIFELFISGFFVFFESLHLSRTPDCEEDYVQFGRDILFITSFRSEKFCGVIDGTFPWQNKTAKPALPPSVTPMSKRIYSESSDQEMDVWVKMSVPSSLNTHKTLSFVVTPFKKSCSSLDSSSGYKRCGSSPHCVREQLFCDGTVNCGLRTDRPEGKMWIISPLCKGAAVLRWNC